MGSRSNRLAVFAALFFSVATADTALSQTLWTAGTGNWNTAANWTLGVPNAASPTAFDAAIENGGTAQLLAVPAGSVRRMRVGRLAGGGNLLVDGVALNITENLHLNEGAGGLASTTIQNGGSIISPNTSIGVSAGSPASFTVTGANSILNSSNLIVGSSGTGTLNIQDNATVTSNTLFINGTSAVNLNGGTLRFNTINGLSRLNYTAGTIRLAGDRNIGTDPVISNKFGALPTIPAGKGLAIEGDLDITTPLAVNGGTLIQPDSGALIDFRLGAAGNPVTLSITNGGDAVINNASTLNHGSSIVVDGPGSTFANYFNDHFILGLEGNAYVTVSNGGTMSTGVTAYIGGFNDDDLGQVIATVKGAGSAWNINWALSIGGNGVMNIEDQGFVYVGSVAASLYDNGVLNLNGGTLRTPEINLFGSSQFNFNSGTLQFTGNRIIGSDEMVTTYFGAAPVIPAGKGLTIEGTATLDQLLTVDGGSFTVGQLVHATALDLKRGTFTLTNQAVTIGPSGLFGSTLDLKNDTTINVTQGITNQGLVTGDGQLGGTFTNAATGELRAHAGRSLRLTGANNTNAGQFKLFGGDLEFTQNLTNSAGGFISGNGSLIVGGGLVNQGTMNFAGTANIEGAVTNAVGGKIISGGGGATIFYDDVTNNGELRTSTNGFTVFFGSVSGSGSFTGTGTVNFEGDLSPGSSPGIVNFAGDVVLGAGSTLQIELGGTAAGTQYDQINVAGELTLDGTLEISLINGFTPSAGQTFDILNWGSLAGAFSSFDLPSLPGLTWDTSQLTSGLLSIAPVLPGDFNVEGSVDAADYVLWRKSPNAFGGDPGGYNTWRTNFSLSAGSANGGAPRSAVPEPSIIELLLLMMASVSIGRRFDGIKES